MFLYSLVNHKNSSQEYAKHFLFLNSRFVTILYYLNNVEEGGETAFIVADNSTLNQSVRS